MGKWKYKLEDEGKQLRKLINDGDETLETVIEIGRASCRERV